jgi:type I restriction enzyme R subunit
MPVRLFRARLDQLEALLDAGDREGVVRVTSDLRADLAGLPANNVVVRENQPHLSRVQVDRFWDRIAPDDLPFLRQMIAPILRATPDANAKVLRFRIDLVELGTALRVGNRAAMDALRESIVEQVGELPPGVNLVARELPLIEAMLGDAWWNSLTDDILRDAADRLAPLMRLRERRPGAMLHLNLADVTAVRQRIVAGPDGRDLAITEYRRLVEETIQALLEANPVLQRLQRGEEISPEDLRELAELLRRQDPEIDEERLRQTYDVRTASFLQLLRHILGVAPLERWSTQVSRMFEEFISNHTTYSALQIRFLQTLRTFILQRGQITRADLVDAPFTRIHPNGVRGVFAPSEIDEVLAMVDAMVA